MSLLTNFQSVQNKITRAKNCTELILHNAPYIPLQYIRSSATQYINTGFNPNGSTRVIAKWTDNSNNGVVFGAYNGAWASGYGMYQNGAYSDGYYYRHYFSNDYTGVRTASSIEMDMNKGTLIMNGSTKFTTATKSNTTSYPMYIFGGNWSGSRVEQKATLSLWYFKIYDDGTLVRDYIPVKDLNNVVCLYDKVNSEFIYNSGTGNFVAGPEI